MKMTSRITWAKNYRYIVTVCLLRCDKLTHEEYKGSTYMTEDVENQVGFLETWILVINLLSIWPFFNY